MAGELDGKCGTCSFFQRWEDGAGKVGSGSCRFWKAERRETGTCESHKPVGSSWGTWKQENAPVPIPGRRKVERDEAEDTRPPLPQEVDLGMDQQEFRRVLRQVLQEELGLADVALGERWRGGEIVLQPGKKDTAEKRIPMDAFFHKIVMLRDKLRVLEQKVNSSALKDDEKVALQQYITGCYGSLTTFNVLFKEKDDQFVGAKGSSGD